MTAQPRPSSSVQADQMIGELEAVDTLRLDDLQIETVGLDDLQTGSTR